MSEFLNPEKVIREIPLSDDATIADFGCGSGGWVIPLAKTFKNAKIYAIDVLNEALSALRSRAEMERVYNISTIRIDLELGTGLYDNFLDLVICSNILFQVEDKEKIIKEARRVLKIGGKLLFVDWETEENETKRIANEKLLENGFKLIKEVNAGERHFGYLYEKI